MEPIRQKELIQQLADKYNISFDEANKAVKSQFKYVAKVAFPKKLNVRLPFFGIFKQKKYQKNYEINKKTKSDESTREDDI